MAEFEYVCDAGHSLITDTRDDQCFCPIHDLPARRRFSFSISRSFPEHFNHSVHRYVNNEREIRDDLKRAAERNSIESGFESDYQYLSPSDMADRKALGVTDEGLEETHRRAHDNNKTV